MFFGLAVLHTDIQYPHVSPILFFSTLLNFFLSFLLMPSLKHSSRISSSGICFHIALILLQEFFIYILGRGSWYIANIRLSFSWDFFFLKVFTFSIFFPNLVTPSRLSRHPICLCSIHWAANRLTPFSIMKNTAHSIGIYVLDANAVRGRWI